MSDKFDPVENALHSLRDIQCESDEHMSDLQTKLMGSYRSVNSASIFARHRTLIVLLGVALIGGSAIAATAVLRKQRLYDVKLSHNGELLSSPRILVNEGQSASLTVSDGEQTFTMEVLEDGSVIYHGRDDIDVDVTVTDIEVDDDHPKQPSSEGSSPD